MSSNKKENILSIVKGEVRKDLRWQIDKIFELCEDSDLQRLVDIVENKNSQNLLFVELDFIVAKLKYFGKLDSDFPDDFGMPLELIPELHSKWRDEKLRNLGL